jgi:hypothetical protein
MPPTDVFLVSQIGRPGTAERRRADEVLRFIVTPAVTALGLRVKRADLEPRPGPILDQLLSDLIASQVVICDLTGRNPNVYYELGLAHALQLKTILMVDQTANLPFDTKHETVIEIGDHGTIGASEAEAASSALRDALEIVLAAGYRPRSAVSTYLDDKSYYPPEIAQATRDASLPLYKSGHRYEFRVLEVLSDTLRVYFGLSYEIINPAPYSVAYELTLTPFRPTDYLYARINGEEVDLDDPGLFATRGLHIPVRLEPDSRTPVQMAAEVRYRCPDSDTFTTYVPSTSFVMSVECSDPTVEFIHEPLMGDRALRTRKSNSSFELRSRGAILAYQGVKLDWRLRST